MLRAKLYFDLRSPCVLSEVTERWAEPFAVSREEVLDDDYIRFVIDTGGRSDEFRATFEASDEVRSTERLDDSQLVVTKRACGALPVIRANHGMLHGMDHVNGSRRVFDAVVFRREDLRNIIADLREIGTVSLGQLTLLDQGRSLLSPRQREVIETALDAGYFEWPREADATEIAASLDITHTTFLEHLRKAEGKLLRDALRWRETATVAGPKEREFVLGSTHA